jgi:hypothetical protein
LIRAEQWSRGEAAVAEEQWKEWRSRGVAVVAGAAPRGAGRVRRCRGAGGGEMRLLLLFPCWRHPYSMRGKSSVHERQSWICLSELR